MLVVLKVEVDDVFVLVLEVVVKELEGEGEILFGIMLYFEINMEVFILDFVIIDVGKILEENIVVEDSEFGNFFMVNMLIIFEILI